MRPITDIRRDRLRQLIDEVAEGNQAKFAEMIGKSRAYVGFWLADPNVKAYAKQIGHEQARAVEAEMRRRGLKQYVAGWLDTNHESQPARLDIAKLGIALTSMDQVIRKSGLKMETQLGKFPDVLNFAYEAAFVQFPKAIPDKGTPEGSVALMEFDALVKKYLLGGIKSGKLGPFERAGGKSPASPRPRAAKSKKAGSR